MQWILTTKALHADCMIGQWDDAHQLEPEPLEQTRYHAITALLLTVMAAAMALVSCVSETPPEPTVKPNIQAMVSTAVSQSLETPVGAPAQARAAHCGRLCDVDFWVRGNSSVNLREVKTELNRGASVKGKDFDGTTPLHWAAGYAERSVVEFLLDEGADVNAKSFDGRTPLHWATDNPRVITLLTDRGANIDTKEDLGMTPLHYAVAGAGNTKAISLLLDRGADIDAKDGEGLICLHWVVRRDILSTEFGYDGLGVASLLLDREADINARMSTGVTPCQVAVNADAKGLLVSREVNQLVCGRQ